MDNNTSLMLSEKQYNAIKFLALILLPAVGTLYFALAGIWHLPSAEAVVGTITAFDTFLGVILKVSTTAYNNSDAKFGGVITLHPNEAEESTDVKFSVDPDKLDQGLKTGEITLKVRPRPGPGR